MNHRAEGSVWEGRAAAFLEKQGYRILEKNFRCRRGEIDLIASCEEAGILWLVFVEVKFRLSDAAGLPEEAVTPSKMRTICRTADYYRLRHGISEEQACRFDVVAVEGRELRHYKNAFSYCP